MIDSFTIFIFLIGVFILFLGWIISTQKCADMLNGFDKNKYDKKKASKIIGKTLIISGVIMLSIGIIGLIFPDTYLNLKILLQKAFMTSIAGIVLIACYKLDKYAKIKK